MAPTHSLSPKLINNLLQLTRRQTYTHSITAPAAAVPSLNLTGRTRTTATHDVPSKSGIRNILDLEDFRGLFSSVSTGKLMRSSATLHVVAIEPVVDLGMWVMNSRLMQMSLVREMVLWTTQRTFYEHFVAGSNTEEAGRTVKKLWDSGLRGMLDYGLEHAVDNHSCDRNLAEFIHTIQSTNSLPPSSVSFVVAKITAICPIALLKRVSDLLRWEYKDSSFHLPWKQDTLPIFSDSSPLYHTIEKPDPLTPEEEIDLQLADRRLTDICEKCVEANVPLVIDAEDTSIQPGIDYFTYSAAIKFNKGEKPIIFSTLQAYLKDAKDRLIGAKKAADKMGLPVGFKLVRGAYMTSEMELASSLGVESPIHNSIQETHDYYNDCASFMLEEISDGPGAVVLATHNVESGALAAKKARDLGIGKGAEKLQFAQLYGMADALSFAKKARDLGIGKGAEKLQFAQLYGMADALSFGLRNAGFDVSKYLPFGPVEQIMPYLLRRAEENKGLLSSSTLDRLLIRKELQRRLKASVSI